MSKEKYMIKIRTLFLLFIFVALLNCAGKTEKIEKLDITINPLSNELLTTNAFPEKDSLFEMDEVAKVTLIVPEGEWNTLLTNFDWNPANETYVKGIFVYEKSNNMEIVSNIGLRIRGGSFSRDRPEGSAGQLHDSDNPSWNHAHFRVNFREYNDDQRFHDLRSLNFKWFNGDPSYVREVYCMDLFRRFGVWTAQRVVYCRFYIHVESDAEPAYFGVYRLMEPVDREFLRNRIPDNDNGYLWKCLYPSSLKYTGAERKMGIENPDEGLSYAYDLKTEKDEFDQAKQQFLDFLYNVQNLEGADFYNWIIEAFDVDLFLKAYAVNVMVGMWDDFWRNENNFYIYFGENDKAYFIPYDYDNTLGTCLGIDTGEQDIWEWGPLNSTRPLMEKIMKIPKFQQTYGYYIAQLISPENDYFNPISSVQRITNWQEMIRPYLDNDVNSWEQIMDEPAGWGNCFEYRLISGTAKKRLGEVNYFLKRVKTAEEQLGLSETDWEPFWIDKEEIDDLPDYVVLKITADISRIDAGEIWISSEDLPTGENNKIRLYDDGTHGDTLADDEIYTIHIPVSNEVALTYKFTGTDAEGNYLTPNANWRPQIHQVDFSYLTNEIHIVY